MQNNIWTIKKILDWAAPYFFSKSIENPRLNAEWLLGEVLQLDRIKLYLNFDQILSQAELSKFKTMIEQRVNHKPLQYILGHYEFMGLDIELNNNVLIPRPETEFLVETVVEHFKKIKKDISILEIGVGSGCIPIALSHYLKANLDYLGLEISTEAIKVAKKNFDKYNLKENFQILQYDFLEGIPENINKKQFNLIISNPPYVTNEEWLVLQPEVKNYEPKTALVAQNDDPLIFYKKIAELKNYLSDEGIIIVEMSYPQYIEISNIFQKNKLKATTLKDYFQKERVLIAQPT